MAGCDVFVLPSAPAESGDQDGLPVVLLEAMAAGCAIVASSLPGVAAALSKLLRDLELRAKLGGAAAEAADDYSIQAVGDQYIDLLRSLAQVSR